MLNNSVYNFETSNPRNSLNNQHTTLFLEGARLIPITTITFCCKNQSLNFYDFYSDSNLYLRILFKSLIPIHLGAKRSNITKAPRTSFLHRKKSDVSSPIETKAKNPLNSCIHSNLYPFFMGCGLRPSDSSKRTPLFNDWLKRTPLFNDWLKRTPLFRDTAGHHPLKLNIWPTLNPRS